MHIVVLIKQVPDTQEVKIDPEKNTLVRAGVESIVNPFDMNATELALQLREQYGGKVTVITMGPPQAAMALKETFSMGVDRVILLRIEVCSFEYPCHFLRSCTRNKET